MRIFVDGIVFSGQPLGGISRLYREVLPRMAETDAGVSFLLYLRRKLKATDLPASNSIKYLYERSVYPWKWVSSTARVQKVLLESAYIRAKPDIFHSTYFTRPDSLRTPYVITVHDMIEELAAEFVQRQGHCALVEQKTKCIRSADLIFSVSNCTTQDILKFHHIDIAKIVTVYHGVGPQFTPVHDEDRKNDFLKRHALSRPFFLYVGMRALAKNFARLLRAYAAFKFRDEIDLVAVGGEEKCTEEETTVLAEKALGTHVKYLKRLTDDDLILAYNTARAFIYPSLYEGFGLPLLEAMACGTPVLASNTSSIPEVAGDAARYFNPQDLDDIRAAMESVLEPSTAQVLIGKGQERARQFSWEQTASRMLQGYQTLSQVIHPVQ